MSRPTPNPTPTTADVTLVLVHDAFADASSWDGVIPRLQQRGATGVAPPNPPRGLTADSACIASVLPQINGPVLLVGHSHGGAVIGRALDAVVQPPADLPPPRGAVQQKGKPTP